MGYRVHLLTTVHPPFDTRIFHKQAKTLVRAGYDVTLIAQHERDEVVDGVKIIALPRPRNRLARMFNLTWKAFRLARRERADVYHFHDPELLPWARLLGLVTRAKVIYDVHEDVPQDVLTKGWIPAFCRGGTAAVVDILERRLASGCDAIVTATEAISRRFAKERTAVIHNYPDLEAFPKPASKTRPNGESLLVYVGAITRERGAREMIEAMALLSRRLKVRLELYGRFLPPELETCLLQSTARARIVPAGWQPWRVAWARAQDADAALLLFHPGPNHTEALPTKLFEYMAAGLPVVASRFPLWERIITECQCGLTVDPLSPREIAEAVGHLVAHPEEAQRMGRNGREAVQQRYNWETEAKKLLDLYSRLLGGET